MRLRLMEFVFGKEEKISSFHFFFPPMLIVRLFSSIGYEFGATKNNVIPVCSTCRPGTMQLTASAEACNTCGMYISNCYPKTGVILTWSVYLAFTYHYHEPESSLFFLNSSKGYQNDSDKTKCSICPAGYFTQGTSGACKSQCPAGQGVNNADRSNAYCQPCDSGQYSQFGVCGSCPGTSTCGTGFILSCDGGYGLVGGITNTALAACAPCSSTSYSPLTYGNGACIPTNYINITVDPITGAITGCTKPGFEVIPGNTWCTQCAPNYYQNGALIGETCRACAIGNGSGVCSPITGYTAWCNSGSARTGTAFDTVGAKCTLCTSLTDCSNVWYLTFILLPLLLQRFN